MRANGWTSIREGLLFEGGFYSRVYGNTNTLSNLMAMGRAAVTELANNNI